MPISLAALPAVALAWESMNWITILVVGVGALLLYDYHLIVLQRFVVIQRNIFEMIKERGCVDVQRIMTYRPALMGVIPLRRWFMVGDGLIWVALVLQPHL